MYGAAERNQRTKSAEPEIAMKNHTLTNEDRSSYARNRRKERMNAGKATGVWRRQSDEITAPKTRPANSRATKIVLT
jgi:hypothetical protein